MNNTTTFLYLVNSVENQDELVDIDDLFDENPDGFNDFFNAVEKIIPHPSDAVIDRIIAFAKEICK